MNRRRHRRPCGAGTRAAQVIAAFFFLASSGGGGQRGGALPAIMPGVSGANYCDSVPASTTVGNPDLTTDFINEHDFACEDGYFLNGVAVWADVFVGAMVWRQVCVPLSVLVRTFLRVVVDVLSEPS